MKNSTETPVKKKNKQKQALGLTETPRSPSFRAKDACERAVSKPFILSAKLQNAWIDPKADWCGFLYGCLYGCLRAAQSRTHPAMPISHAWFMGERYATAQGNLSLRLLLRPVLRVMPSYGFAPSRQRAYSPGYTCLKCAASASASAWRPSACKHSMMRMTTRDSGL